MSIDLSYAVGLDDGPFKQGVRRIQDSIKETHAGVANMVSGMQGAFGTLNKIIAGVTSALAGGAGIAASVAATQQFTGEAVKLARVLGTTTTEASALNVALGDIYADADVFTGAASKLAKELRTNESALQAMGLRTRDASGQLRPLNDLMMESIQVVNSYKQGVDRNIASQTMWGKGAEEAAQLLKLNSKVVDEARQKQEALGLVVGGDNVLAYNAYRAALNDAGDVTLALRKAIGDTMIPVLTQLGQRVADTGAEIVSFGKIIGDAIRIVIETVSVLGANLKFVFESIGREIGAVGAQLMLLFDPSSWGSGRWTAISDAVKADGARARKELDAFEARVLGVGYTQANAWGREDRRGSRSPDPGGRSAAGLVKSGKEEVNVVQAWDAELNIIRQKQAEENALNDTFYEVSKQYEKAFWEAKRDLTARGSKERLAVEAKVTAATLEVQKEAFELRIAQLKREEALAEQDFKRREALAQKEVDLVKSRFGAESKQAEDAQRRMEDVQRQARDQRRQLREIELAEIQANALQTVELERQRQQYLFEAGLVTREELLASEQAFEQRRFEIQAEALVQRQQLIDPNLNPVEYARIKDEILQLEREHQTRVQELKNQAELLATTNSRGIWNSVTTNMEQSLSKMIQGMSSFSGFVKAIWNSLRASVADVLAKMAMDYIKNTALMAGIKKALAIFDIGTDAARAGAGAAASAASTPVIGWLTAPAAAASVFAMTSAFAGQIPGFSAAQGWDIPAGINPVVQAHAREMILPAEQADVIRELGGGGSGGDHYHVTLNALDARSSVQWMRDNPEALAEGFKGAKRRGWI